MTTKPTPAAAAPATTDDNQKPAPAKAASTSKRRAVNKEGYVAVHRNIRNPYTGDMFTVAGAKKVAEMDGWLECQIEAGLIREV